MNFAMQCHVQPAMNIGGGGFRSRLAKLVSAAKIVKPVTTWRTRPIFNRYYQIPILSSSFPIIGGACGGGGDDGRGNWKSSAEAATTKTTMRDQSDGFSHDISLLNKITEVGIQWCEAESKKLRSGDYGPSEEENPETSGKPRVM